MLRWAIILLILVTFPRLAQANDQASCPTLLNRASNSAQNSLGPEKAGGLGADWLDENPGKNDWTIMLHIFRYGKTTTQAIYYYKDTTEHHYSKVPVWYRNEVDYAGFDPPIISPANPNKTYCFFAEELDAKDQVTFIHPCFCLPPYIDPSLQ